MFTDLRKLKRGTGFDPESETAVFLTVVVLSYAAKVMLLMNSLTTFLDHAAHQIRCVV